MIGVARRAVLLGLLALAPGWSSLPHQPRAETAPTTGAGGRAATSSQPARARGYRVATAPYRFAFPRDHASHPEFQTEWWYYTGHLMGGGRRYGYELTFFRVGISRERAASRSAWAPHTLYFAHFALTDETTQRFRFDETISRGALGMAGADSTRYRVWIDDWSAELDGDDWTHLLSARAPGYALDLTLTPAKPPAIHGRDGVSLKAQVGHHASHYYSLTRLETQGTLTVDGLETAVTGLSWMDHEFGTSTLAPGQRGWDWFALQLDDGRDLMLYVLRDSLGRADPASSGTLIGRGGETRHLPFSSFLIEATGRWRSPRTGGNYPAGWIVRVPDESPGGEGLQLLEQSLELRVEPTIPDQELVTRSTAGVAYWEGSVRVTGRSRGRPISGRGYVELTGYAGRAPGL
jgi:predicted secreted hydrolase